MHKDVKHENVHTHLRHSTRKRIPSIISIEIYFQDRQISSMKMSLIIYNSFWRSPRMEDWKDSIFWTFSEYRTRSHLSLSSWSIIDTDTKTNRSSLVLISPFFFSSFSGYTFRWVLIIYISEYALHYFIELLDLRRAYDRSSPLITTTFDKIYVNRNNEILYADHSTQICKNRSWVYWFLNSKISFGIYS